jgi:hypothetical protein
MASMKRSRSRRLSSPSARSSGPRGRSGGRTSSADGPEIDQPLGDVQVGNAVLLLPLVGENAFVEVGARISGDTSLPGPCGCSWRSGRPSPRSPGSPWDPDSKCSREPGRDREIGEVSFGSVRSTGRSKLRANRPSFSTTTGTGRWGTAPFLDADRTRTRALPRRGAWKRSCGGSCGERRRPCRRAGRSRSGVHVGPVHVNQAALVVDDPGDARFRTRRRRECWGWSP